jgi:hypothetical protein
VDKTDLIPAVYCIARRLAFYPMGIDEAFSAGLVALAEAPENEPGNLTLNRVRLTLMHERRDAFCEWYGIRKSRWDWYTAPKILGLKSKSYAVESDINYIYSPEKEFWDKVLAKAPKLIRLILILHFRYEQDYPTIAAKLKWKDYQVQTRVKRFFRRVRRLYPDGPYGEMIHEKSN